MAWEKIVAYSSSLLYLSLISLFIYYARMEIICDYNSPCLRFCSLDTEKYPNKVLFDEFMDSNLSDWYNEDQEFDRVNIFRGPPLCNDNIKPLEVADYEDSDYSNEIRIYQSGILYANNEKYAAYAYCLERDADQKIIPLVCTQVELTWQQSAAITMTVASIIILVLTLGVYLYYPELRDFKGKMIIYFLISMICTYMVVPGFFNQERSFFHFFNFLIALGFSSGSLWLNSMILNIYFRVRDFRDSKPREDNFSSYGIYVGVFTSLVVLFSVWQLEVSRFKDAVPLIEIWHSYFRFIGLVILIYTFFKLRNISKHIGFSEREQFKKEKKFFWINVKLFAIMSVTWSTQIFALEEEANHFCCLTVSLIMLLSAFNVSSLFVGRKKVINLLFKKNLEKIEDKP